MVDKWLQEIMTSYNHDSFEARDSYAAQVYMPGKLFQNLVWWALQALPDEILVGLDIDANRRPSKDIEEVFVSEQQV